MISIFSLIIYFLFFVYVVTGVKDVPFRPLNFLRKILHSTWNICGSL